MTDFEDLFKKTFPDIYRLHVLGKPMNEGGGGEVHIWKMVDAVLTMNLEQTTGKLEVYFNKGRINDIKQTKDIIAYKASRPGYEQTEVNK